MLFRPITAVSAATLTLLLACGPRDPEESWRIDVLGAPVGVEHRTIHGDDLTSRRLYRYRAGARAVDVTRESRWHVEEGRVTAYHRADVSVTFEPDAAPWSLTAPPPPGEVAIFDPTTGLARDGEVVVHGVRRVFSDGDVTWWTEGDPVVAYGDGVVSVRRDVPWLGDAVDPAEVLGWPVQGDALPDAARVIRLRLDDVPMAVIGRRPRQVVTGAEVRVEVPLRQEIRGVPLAGDRISPPAAMAAAVARVTRGVPGRDQRDDIAVMVDRVMEEVRWRPTPTGSWRVALSTGDCTERAALFVASARAVGLAARPVQGWVYRDEPAFRGFVPHAWAEVDVGGAVGWLGVDPSLGQLIADATHVVMRATETPWIDLGRAGPGTATVLSAR